MKKLLVVLLTLTLAIGLVSPALASDAPKYGYIVKLRDEARVSLQSDGGSSGQGLIQVESAAELRRLIAGGQVEYYEENAAVKLLARPSDPYYIYQWSLNDLGAEAAWEAGLDGEGAVVAVIDSGVYAGHEDLQGVNITAGENLITGDSDVSDALGHGTGVCGVISAVRDNGLGVAGIADKVTIVPLKCFESEDETDILAVCDGIYKAVDQYGCNVICLSLGSDSDVRAMREAVEHAAANNVIIVAAVGNRGGSDYYYPAAYDSVVGVGSYGPLGLISEFSQFNDSVFVSAPGEGIYSTGRKRSSDYAIYSGTSFSTPHVAAMAAIAKSADPSLTVEEFKQLLITTSVDAGQPGYDSYFGHGKANIKNLVAELQRGQYHLLGFTDISGHWAESSIEYAVNAGYFEGLTDAIFDPEGGMNRAMLVTVLWRRAGEPEPDMSQISAFADVTDPAEWYYRAVYWAAANGIVEGDKGYFSPLSGITREQIATILWRYAGRPDSGAASMAGYVDVSEISDYAVSAMSWCTAVGLMRGDNGALTPKGPATRAQVAALIERYDLL